MADDPDANSPYFILRKADPDDHTSTVKLLNDADAGPPPRIRWEPAYYGKADERPVDIYTGMGGTSPQRLCRAANLPVTSVFVSAVLQARLLELAPGAFVSTPVVLVGPKADAVDYFAITAHAHLAATEASEAKPNDLQWSTVSFSETDAPAEVFTLTSDIGNQLIVSRRIVDGLGSSFREVHASAFHRTGEDGGVRPAMAALDRVVHETATPQDHATVSDALRRKP